MILRGDSKLVVIGIPLQKSGLRNCVKSSPGKITGNWSNVYKLNCIKNKKMFITLSLHNIEPCLVP